MDVGRFAEAAKVFERLSDRAKRFDMPLRAAGLDLQAARAHLAADDAEAGRDRAAEAFRWFVRGGRAKRVPQVLNRVQAALRERGYDAQALEGVGLSLDEARSRAPRAPAAPSTERRGTLPASCSGCGAPLVPDEVEWHDAHTAECLYCATIVKATSA
jgi:hypothetical protein